MPVRSAAREKLALPSMMGLTVRRIRATVAALVGLEASVGAI